jgi:hypothetical protein
LMLERNSTRLTLPSSILFMTISISIEPIWK